MDSYVVYCKEGLLADLPLLIIPVAHVSEFSTKPFKWIRYITAAMLGSEGNLLRYNKHEDHIGDLTLDLEDVAPPQRKLLFIPKMPIKFIDRGGLDHLQSSQFTTESYIEFRSSVATRDRNCVISDVPPLFCKASHLIPHSKGMEYNQALCRWRTAVEEPEIADINDVKNGIFWDENVHRMFVVDRVGVLPTPNFALSTEEVLPNSTNEDAPLRFTPHYFLPDNCLAPEKALVDRYRQDFRYPTDVVNGWSVDWPSFFLFDFIYGVFIAKKYGNKDAIDVLNHSTESKYYPQGIQAATDRARAAIQQCKLEEAELTREQQDARAERVMRDGGAEEGMDLSDAYDTVFCLWMQSRFGPDGQRARVEEMAEHARREQERQCLTAEKVDIWRQMVED